jgi:hypothetical protein
LRLTLERGSIGTLSRIAAAVHNAVPSTNALFPYLPADWVERVEHTMFKGPTEFYYPQSSPIAAQPGSRPQGTARDAATGARPRAGLRSVVPAASNLDLVRTPVLEGSTWRPTRLARMETRLRAPVPPRSIC